MYDATNGAVSSPREIVRRNLVWATFLLLVFCGCQQKWDVTQNAPKDEELDTAFFSGLAADEIPDLPEPQSLRPCCIFGNDVGVQVGSVPLPRYEVRNVLDADSLGTHQYDHGTISLQPRGGERIVSDEESGILYTC